ncbi:MAG: hypothetical protein M1537_00100 [Nitrospirae bacterium]|nr:hypothetical protein [Nitrospirota bacterium]
MSSTAVHDILSRLGRFGIQPGLERMNTILDLLGHPEEGPFIFQIVGTNGKGSTAAAIDGILRAAGYRTGRYTSPHLFDVRERIMISGTMVPALLFETLVRDIDSLCRRHHLELSFFEFLTAVAFQSYSQSDCQILVLEAGLGGRWDATTSANPAVTVLTQVARDHEEILGEGIDRIFEEKVAVGRTGKPFVATLSEPSLRERFLNRHRTAGFIPVLNGRDFSGGWTSPDNINGEPRPFHYNGRWGERDLASPLSATYQIDNLSGAVAALEWSTLPLSPRSFREGLLGLENPGRLEVVRISPRVVLDGAHNPSAVLALCRALRDRYGTSEEFGFFLGIHAVKDWKSMLRTISSEAKAFFFPDMPISTTGTLPADGSWVAPSDMVQMIRGLIDSGASSPEIMEGERESLFQKASAWAGAKSNRTLVATGSLYLVGFLRTILRPSSDSPLFSLNERDLPGPGFS